MTEQNQTSSDASESDDTEGHHRMMRRADVEETSDDVEGHGHARTWGADVEETSDDVEGHIRKDADDAEGDDTEGHGYRH